MYYYDEIIFNYFKTNLEIDGYEKLFSILKNDNLKEHKYFSDIEKEVITAQNIVERDQLEKDLKRVGKSYKRMIDESDYLSNQVVELLKLPQPEQRSPEWYKMRENMITASDWASAINLNPYSNRKKLLLKKLGHEGSQFSGNSATRWGQKYEPVATLIYETREEKEIIEFGCIPHPTIDFLGASPDGITPDGVMVEIKCPPRRKITGIPPIYYWCQVQGQLEVCDLERCDFLECKLGEYESDQEYFDDLENSSNRSKKYGMESGMIIEFSKNDNPHFEYSKIGITLEESNIWITEMISKLRKEDYQFCNTCCWFLEKVSCVPIFRDKEWFVKAHAELKLFWEDWQKYKDIGYETLLPKKRLKVKDSGEDNDSKLVEYEGFFKTSNIEQKSDKDFNEFNKLNLGFLQGVPIQGFAFKDMSFYNELMESSDEEYISNEKDIESEEDDMPKVCMFSFSSDKDIEKKSKKKTSKFMFSSEKKVESKPKKKPSRFMFSD